MSELAHVEAAAHNKAEVIVGLPELWEKAKIKSDQDSIRKSLVKIDAQIHANLIQCYLHAEKHGDTSMTRRLLVEVVDAKSGYRRQGMIVHMRKFTPMELVGDVIKLTGVTINDKGEEVRKPWLIEEANRTAFTSLVEAREQIARPIFRDTLFSKLNAAQRDWKACKANTVMVNGKPAPIDKTKPYFDGLHFEALDVFFTELDKNVTEIVSTMPDSTKDVRTAQEISRKAQAVLDAEAQNAA